MPRGPTRWQLHEMVNEIALLGRKDLNFLLDDSRSYLLRSNETFKKFVLSICSEENAPEDVMTAAKDMVSRVRDQRVVLMKREHRKRGITKWAQGHVNAVCRILSCYLERQIFIAIMETQIPMIASQFDKFLARGVKIRPPDLQSDVEAIKNCLSESHGPFHELHNGIVQMAFDKMKSQYPEQGDPEQGVAKGEDEDSEARKARIKACYYRKKPKVLLALSRSAALFILKVRQEMFALRNNKPVARTVDIEGWETEVW